MLTSPTHLRDTLVEHDSHAAVVAQESAAQLRYQAGQFRTAPSRSAPCNPARGQPGRKRLPATNSEDDISLPAECLGERPRGTRANSRRLQGQQARADGPRPRLLAAWACHCWR